MYGKLLLQVLALCVVVWHRQGDGVTTAFMVPKPMTTAPGRTPLVLQAYMLEGSGGYYPSSIANDLTVRGYGDRWNDYGYYGGRDNNYYGMSYGGGGGYYGTRPATTYGGQGRTNRMPWYCDNDLRSFDQGVYHESPYYNNGSFNNRGGYGNDRSYYYDPYYYNGGRSYNRNNYDGVYGYGGGQYSPYYYNGRNRNSYFRSGSYNRMVDSFY